MATVRRFVFGLVWLFVVGATTAQAKAQTELRLSVDTLALLNTAELHGLKDSVTLNAPGRFLYGGTFEAGVAWRHFGVRWFSLTVVAARGWNVERTVKYQAGAPPSPITDATAVLLVYRLPAPLARLHLGPLGLAFQGTVGARTGSVFGRGGVSASPVELVLPLRLSFLVRLGSRWSLDATAEWVHSLATGNPSVLLGVGITGTPKLTPSAQPGQASCP